MADRICTVDECGKKHHAIGLCRLHYQRQQANGDPFTIRRASSREVRRHVRTLIESGWTRYQIAEEAPVAYRTLTSILSRTWDTVTAATADALLSLEPLRGPVYLDAGPLIEVLERRRFPTTHMTDTDRAAVLRARKSGFLRDDVADRLCVRYFGLTLEEVWGSDWDAQVAS